MIPLVTAINAECETVANLPTFRDAYRRRRCILPVDGFFEWKAIKGHKAKQPFAIAMNDGTPFGIGGIWENVVCGIVSPLLDLQERKRPTRWSAFCITLCKISGTRFKRYSHAKRFLPRRAFGSIRCFGDSRCVSFLTSKCLQGSHMCWCPRTAFRRFFSHSNNSRVLGMSAL